MAPTDPPDANDTGSTPAATAKGGRPGVTREQVADAVDTWIARTGHAPSVRELRTALGETGSLSTLGRHLREVLADRLLVGATPDRGSPEEILIKSMKAALGLLAGEAAGAADDAIAQGAREADTRIAAAEGLQARARAQADTAEKEREHALGRASALDDQLVSMKAELADARKALTEAQGREDAAKQLNTELELSLQSVREERRRLEQAQTEQQQQQKELKAELTETQQLRDALQATLATITAERDAAQGTVGGLQTALDQADKRVNAVRRNLADTKAERDSVRETLNQERENRAATEKKLAQAAAAADQASKERDTLLAEQNRMGEIRAQLSSLLIAVEKKR